MKNFRTPSNYQSEVPVISALPSKTVPGMDLTIRDIMQKWTTGQPVMSNKNFSYTGDFFAKDVRTMDLTEIDELKEFIDNRVETLKTRIQDESKPKEPATGTKPTGEQATEGGTTE